MKSGNNHTYIPKQNIIVVAIFIIHQEVIVVMTEMIPKDSTTQSYWCWHHTAFEVWHL